MPFTNPYNGGAAIPYAYSFSTPDSSKTYEATQQLIAGLYNITPSGGTVSIEFWGPSGLIGQATGITAVTAFNLGSAATMVLVNNRTANTSLLLELKSSPVAAVSGVFTVYTATQVIPLRGRAAILLIAPGGGGTGTYAAWNGGGGSGGGWAFSRVTLTGVDLLTIGAPGVNATDNSGATGSPGGTCTFMSLSCPGGQPGGRSNGSTVGPGGVSLSGTGGDINGPGGNGGAGQSGGSPCPSIAACGVLSSFLPTDNGGSSPSGNGGYGGGINGYGRGGTTDGASPTGGALFVIQY